MAEVINMPRLSDTMGEGTVASWLKKVGDKIEEGDILAEIETDKATMEFESFYEGVLLHIGVQEGETTKVDELLAIIGEEGEDISAVLANSANSKDADSTNAVETSSSHEPQEVKSADNQELPEGVIVVTMPRLSDTMEEGTVATWLKKVGDTVEEGDILAEIETDKATMEFESFQSGTLLHVGLNEGDSAKVDSLLAIIGPAGTDVANIAKNFKTVSSDSEATPKVAEPKVETKKETSKEATSTNTTQVSSVSSNGRIFASPLAKKIAQEKGIDLTQVKGTGENGRVVKKDVENFTPSTNAAARSSAPLAKFVPTGTEDFDEVSNSNMRKAIAKNLAKSKFSAPHYYLNVEFDMDNAIAFRKQYNSLPDIKISYNDMIVKACALALRQHPQVNCCASSKVC